MFWISVFGCLVTDFGFLGGLRFVIALAKESSCLERGSYQVS